MIVDFRGKYRRGNSATKLIHIEKRFIIVEQKEGGRGVWNKKIVQQKGVCVLITMESTPTHSLPESKSSTLNSDFSTLESNDSVHNRTISVPSTPTRLSGQIIPASQAIPENDNPDHALEIHHRQLNGLFGIRPWKPRVEHRDLNERSESTQRLYNPPSSLEIARDCIFFFFISFSRVFTCCW